ncbi:ATP-binding protein [Thiothrix unzii]|uniref:histidine kinase n=1 Tax=Thiothrix unzii TaxID=111769 RepID=A0A975IHF3_9GAMM|nr:HAMP domain-containing sensor histidine kinase [Thiothrix unzii]QTR54126.1 HAMP domain-containing histidine kinase [Thiothrix unzii]
MPKSTHTNTPDFLADEVQQRLEERYKLLFTRVVVPVLAFAAVFLVAGHWNNDSKMLWQGLVAAIVLTLLNIALSLLQSIPTRWGEMRIRSDTFDTLRWCINFPFDVFILWSLGVQQAAATTIWLLLTFAAMVDVHKPRNKLVTIAAAFAGFCALVFWVFPTDWGTELYLVSCYLGLVFILWKLERYVAQEMAAVFTERGQRERVEREAETLQREAAIGHSTRAINHELNTLIGVARLSAERIRERQTNDTAEKDLQRLERALSYMAKVSALVLDDLGSQHATKRLLSLAELQDDLRLLLCNGVTHCHARLEFDFPPNAADYRFEERTGSTYLILHDLAKNAYEAVQEKFGEQPGGIIRISAAVEGEKLVLSVYDNGVGMTAQQVEDIRQQVATSSKVSGHGLGLQFVWRECSLNNFSLLMTARSNVNSNFSIIIAT